MQETTDHESILLLRQDIKNLKESQDTFHRDMKISMDDLKNNYSGRLDAVEARTKKLEDSSYVVKGVLILASVCASLVLYIYFLQQSAQDVQIERITQSLTIK
jgi:hypothetical protein